MTKKASILIIICFLAALALTGCKGYNPPPYASGGDVKQVHISEYHAVKCYYVPDETQQYNQIEWSIIDFGNWTDAEIFTKLNAKTAPNSFYACYENSWGDMYEKFITKMQDQCADLLCKKYEAALAEEVNGQNVYFAHRDEGHELYGVWWPEEELICSYSVELHFNTSRLGKLIAFENLKLAPHLIDSLPTFRDCRERLEVKNEP